MGNSVSIPVKMHKPNRARPAKQKPRTEGRIMHFCFFCKVCLLFFNFLCVSRFCLFSCSFSSWNFRLGFCEIRQRRGFAWFGFGLGFLFVICCFPSWMTLARPAQKFRALRAWIPLVRWFNQIAIIVSTWLGPRIRGCGVIYDSWRFWFMLNRFHSDIPWLSTGVLVFFHIFWVHRACNDTILWPQGFLFLYISRIQIQKSSAQLGLGNLISLVVDKQKQVNGLFFRRLSRLPTVSHFGDLLAFVFRFFGQ